MNFFEFSFNEYDFKCHQTAIYPDAGSGSERALCYVALGLAGEAGEFAEKVKKKLRDGTFDKELMLKELGDVLWYLSRCSAELDSNLNDVAVININKLTKRKEEGKLQGSGDTR